jgi:protein gp37
MWDWNSNGVKDEWIKSILEKIKECPQHTFQILSQRPIRYNRFEYPKNVWLGTTVRNNDDVPRIKELMMNLFPSIIKFISFEPLHEEIYTWLIGTSQFYKIDWVIIGAETGNRIGKIIPKKEWIDKIIYNARLEGIPIFLKDNLKWGEIIQEFPKVAEVV